MRSATVLAFPSSLTKRFVKKHLARQIAGRDASAHIQMLARRVAEVQVDLRRIRYARHQFLSEALADRYRYESQALTRMKLQIIKHFLTPKLADVSLQPSSRRFSLPRRKGRPSSPLFCRRK